VAPTIARIASAAADPPGAEDDDGDAAHDALPSASPVQVFPEHCPLAEPDTWMLSVAFKASMHCCRLSPVSTYCPSQKRAPSGFSQRALHPPSSRALQSTTSFD